MKIFKFFFCVLLSSQVFGQTIVDLSPGAATIGTTTTVIIRGINSNFKNGQTVADFGEGILVQNPINVQTPTMAAAVITVLQTAAPGFRNVTVTTGSEVITKPNGFEVFTISGNFKALLEIVPYETYNAADFDVTNISSLPILFFVNLINDNQSREVNIEVSLSTQNYGKVATLSVKKNLQPNQQERISNRNFEKITISGSQGSGGYAFADEVRRLGQFPPDNYEVELVVKDKDGSVISTDKGNSVVSNPFFNPELIAPGNEFWMNPAIIYTEFPLFQWFGQNERYDFVLYKVLPGQTAEEVVRNIHVFKQENITGNSFQYPAYAEQLIDGQVYAWQITGKVITSRGVIQLPSQVFRFIYQKPADQTGRGRRVARIEVVPSQAQIPAGSQFQFAVNMFDQDNLPIGNRQPQWRVVPANMGTININGVFTAGINNGTAAVIAMDSGLQDFATVTITGGAVSGGGGRIPDWKVELLMKQLFGIQNR
ncbi:MAG: hypothetical protein ACK4EX_10895 [Thermaurantimonas sp.]|uniref:BIG2 domain-containing protein n=1 Tax=Thermaurantimonas aggregans TaxID=2173829 RepID=A0A401XJD9_9FLAO|nr:hypothetical protein [Thermaurantimonas aggregans]MCX8148693.1 hypothetical protein [Thermaurantimonas aggregans]GCD77157.1 hypothetical protein JCM31826_06390 [Thermaurantimonas aggregans]